MLEESIDDLQKKAKAIEEQNRELEIEAASERVRSVAMGMKEPSDMLEVCQTISHQLELLHVKEISNVQTAIFHEEKGTYSNYEFYAKHDKVLITEVDYENHSVALEFANQMLKGSNEVFIHGFKGKEVQEWLDYTETTNAFLDTYLETAEEALHLSLIFIRTLFPLSAYLCYAPLNEEEIDLFNTFPKSV